MCGYSLYGMINIKSRSHSHIQSTSARARALGKGNLIIRYIILWLRENVFLVRNGKIFTPELTSCLDGITRNTIFEFAKELGLEVSEKRITRDEVYVADEAFFTGTAAEISPIATVDKITIGEGRRGPITTEIQQYFFELLSGKREDKFGWLTMI